MPGKLVLFQIFELEKKKKKKINIFYPLIRAFTCRYQGVRIVSFSGNFANVLNE